MWTNEKYKDKLRPKDKKQYVDNTEYLVILPKCNKFN